METFCVPPQILHHTNFCQSSMRGLGNTMLVHGRMFFVERLRRFAPRPSTGRFAPYGPSGLSTWQGPLVIEVRLRLPHRSATRSAWSVALLPLASLATYWLTPLRSVHRCARRCYPTRAHTRFLAALGRPPASIRLLAGVATLRFAQSLPWLTPARGLSTL